MKNETISVFVGRNEFLSNFYPSKIKFASKIWPTVEHAFQAYKTKDKTEREKIRLLPHPGVAKRAGRSVQLREDWEKVKTDLMYQLVKAKFVQNKNLREMLLMTGEAFIIEGNTWHDNIWGQCCCSQCRHKIQGENRLGQILMQVRTELMEQNNEE